MTTPRPLTPKQQLFVAEYLKDLNATQAAIRAGYSEKAAKETGYRLLTNTHVQAEISMRQGKQLQKVNLTAETVKENLRRVLAADIRSLFDESGNLRPIHTLSDEAAALVGGCEVVKRNLVAGDGKVDLIIKIKMVDRSKYAELAAKHLGLLTEKVALTVNDDRHEQFKAMTPEERASARLELQAVLAKFNKDV